MKEIFTAENAEDAEKIEMDRKAKTTETWMKAHLLDWEIKNGIFKSHLLPLPFVQSSNFSFHRKL